jgi:hypothetical protein
LENIGSISLPLRFCPNFTIYKFTVFAPSRPSSEEYRMKYLLRVLFVFALTCGFASHARAVDFHAQVLDPVCSITPDATCTLLPGDPGTSFPITLNALTCTDQGVTGLPTDGTPFGCFAGFNQTGFVLTSIDVSFDGALLAGVGCDTTLPEGIAGPTGGGPAFSLSSCTPPSPGDPDFSLSFTGGSIGRTRTFILIETGINPADFVGTGVVGAATPEPESLALLSTGVMMMMAGLYLKQSRFAFGKK